MQKTDIYGTNDKKLFFFYLKSSADEYITFYTTTHLTGKAKIFGLYIITKATGLLFYQNPSLMKSLLL